MNIKLTVNRNHKTQLDLAPCGELTSRLIPLVSICLKITWWRRGTCHSASSQRAREDTAAVSHSWAERHETPRNPFLSSISLHHVFTSLLLSLLSHPVCPAGTFWQMAFDRTLLWTLNARQGQDWFMVIGCQDFEIFAQCRCHAGPTSEKKK